MSDLFATMVGATPLTAEEEEGLKQTWIATRANLNSAEESNIEQALTWLRRQRSKDVLREDFVLKLHKQMLGEVWTWAGAYRTTGKNLGVDPVQIRIRLLSLFDDTKYWIENGTFSVDEIAIRFHHQLVAIHPFVNGNGRHARLMADHLIQKLGGVVFTWGHQSLIENGKTRDEYLTALKAADRLDIEPLLEFSRT
ncbi:MAG: cell filamentation protein Fic [Robiginitomaculum sp.]|nr:MAG: cell filamentation protein Fic [Robiginitomaculum sp.]